MTRPSGAPLLVVEDDPLIAGVIRELLVDLGCELVCPATTVAQALAFIESDGAALRAALLDVRLGPEPSYPVAERLVSLRIPFAFMTGGPHLAEGAAFAAIPSIAKPFDLEDMERLINELIMENRLPGDD